MPTIVNERAALRPTIYKSNGPAINLSQNAFELNRLVAMLFNRNEQGFFYDPSDMTTMFQDTTGTNPVTAVGQPISVLVDKSKGVAVGPELWIDSKVAFSGGSLRLGQQRYQLISLDGSYSGFSCNTTPSIKDSWVLLQFTVEELKSGSVGTEFTSQFTVNAVGTYKAIVRSAVAGATFKRVSNTDAVVSNVSVRRILGNHAYQNTSAARPLLQGSPNRIAYDGVDDKLITSLPSALTNCTVLRAIPNVGTQVKYNQTLPMLYEDTTPHAGLIAIDRALTRTEQLRLMTELDKKAGATSLETLTFKVFDNNQEGFVYDPNDLSTMYQDSTGLTPVTGIGQPVGLILDKRKGSATGINLHTTATPMNTTTYPATGTRSGLDINISKEESGYASVSLGMPTVVGKTYLLELIAPDLAGFWVLVSDGLASDSINRRAAVSTAPISKINTKITLVFTATAPVSYIHLNRGSTHNLPVTFKNVSCREVLGNYASQSTSASRPILRKNAVTGANYLEFDGVDDNLELGRISLPIPFSHVVALEDRKLNGTQALFSGGGSGYLMITGDSGLAVQQNAGNPTMYALRGKKEVVTHIANSAGVTLKSNLSTATRNDLAHANPYTGVTPKYIGVFNNTQFTTASRIDYYGGVFIKKTINSAEEEEIRAQFNKRIGV